MIKQREFKTYQDYVSLQGGKASRPGFKEMLLDAQPRIIKKWISTFTSAKPFLRKGSILCLGARCGAETIGAQKAGFPGSIGIDLHPCAPKVVRADWHFLPFKKDSFPNIFTNSLDHCFDLEALIAESRRVLTSNGIFYLVASDRRSWKGIPPEERMVGFEALFWENSLDLCHIFTENGFKVRKTWKNKETSHYFLEKKE